nr:hypothetical protein [Rhizoctonia sp.]
MTRPKNLFILLFRNISYESCRTLFYPLIRGWWVKPIQPPYANPTLTSLDVDGSVINRSYTPTTTYVGVRSGARLSSRRLAYADEGKTQVRQNNKVHTWFLSLQYLKI